MLYQTGNDEAIEWRVNKPRADPGRNPPLDYKDNSCVKTSASRLPLYKDDDLMALRLHWVVFQCNFFEAYPQHAILMKEVVDAMKGLCKACVITVPAYVNDCSAAARKAGEGHLAVDAEAGGHCGHAITVKSLISGDIHPPDLRDNRIRTWYSIPHCILLRIWAHSSVHQQLSRFFFQKT